MKTKLLHIELLKYILNKNNHFGFEEIRPFLLKNFPEEPNWTIAFQQSPFLSVPP
jgi:hypothetical protein